MNLAVLFIFILSLFHASNGAVTKNAAQPKWNMTIANLSADAGKYFPFADYNFTLLPGNFTPKAICSAHLRNPIKTKPNNKTHPLLGTPWIPCRTLSTAIDDQNNASDDQKNASDGSNGSDLPPQQPANVSFKWTQRGDGGALLKVDANYTIELGELYASFPDLTRGKIQQRDDSTDIFLYQRGTFNISSDDIRTGEVYTGVVNVTTAVDWLMVCQGTDDCN